MEYRYVITDCLDPYRNLAYEQLLQSEVDSGMAILYLWQNENTIVVGRNQEIGKECRAEAFLQDGGRIARRRSGGGAVYHDLGNLNFSLICREKEKACYPYQPLVIGALKEFGLEASFNGRNDFTVQGRKFSGNAFYSDGVVACRHGTLLVSCEIARMTRYLTPDKSKLSRNHVASVFSRVVNLGELSAAVTVDALRQALIRVSGATPLKKQPSEREIASLALFYASETWIYGGNI